MSKEDLRAEEALLGNWPRRLLHVPTMTSYEWGPGNCYGPFESPLYNALTYTWGRWELRENQKPEVLPLDIKNISWECPRTDPDHFHPSQLQKVLQRMTANVDTGSSRPEPNIEFVWLDIACIDQRRMEPRSTAEIGRQAAIFRGARRVFAWLTTIPDEDLSHAFQDLQMISQGMEMLVSGGSEDALSDDKMKRGYECLVSIVKDPWFSSLWTLQEAFLRTDAWLMGQRGHVASTHYKVQLRHLLRCCDIYNHDILRNILRSKSLHDSYHRFVRLIQQTGLVAMSTRSVLAAYTSASCRTTSREEDRIYGIQQIFGFRLGSSAVSQSSPAAFSIVELRREFARTLLRIHPVLSQMHVFTEECPVGSAWMVGGSSIMPRNSELVVHIGETNEKSITEGVPCAELSTLEVSGTLWGTFDGLMCSYSRFSKISTYISAVDNVSLAFILESRKVEVFLDTTTELKGLDDFKSTRNYRDVGNEVAEWLSDLFPDDMLQVLLIGWRKQMTGLILLRAQTPGNTYYRRIGFCCWSEPLPPGHPSEPEFESSVMDMLRGSGSSWRRESGIFG